MKQPCDPTGPPGPAVLREREAGWPPHIRSGRYVEHFHRALLAASLPAVVAGCVIFSVRTLLVCGLAVVSALVAEYFCQTIARRHPSGPARRIQRLHACLLGSLLALTLPVSVSWQVPVVGAFAAVAIGKCLLGGLGNYLWHPSLIGYCAVQLLFSGQVSPDRSAVLASGHQLSGSVSVTADEADYFDFGASSPPAGIEAWSLPRPMGTLSYCYRPSLATAPNAGETGLLVYFRDRFPRWSETVWGHVAGGIGETCVPALALGGLLLMYRGYARWRLPLAALLTVLLLAAVWPIYLRAGSEDGTAELIRYWLPVACVQERIPVGGAVVLFHLTGGGLWLACLVAVSDPMSIPLTSRGQWVFGVGVGVLTMVARCNPWFPGLPGSAYWAVLAMNSLVPWIDRLTRRRVLGT